MRYFHLIAAIAAAMLTAEAAFAVGFHGGGGFHGGMAGGFHGGMPGGFHGGGMAGGFGGGGFRPPASFGGLPGMGGGVGRMPSINAFPSNFSSRGGFAGGAPRAPLNNLPSGFNFNHAGLPGGGFAGVRPGGASAANLSSFLHLSPPAGGAAGNLPGVARPNFLPPAGGGTGGGELKNPFAAGHAGNRPAWNNLSPAAASQLRNKFNNSVRPGSDNIDKMHSWLDDHPERAQQWQNQADKIRQGWQNHPIGGDWWSQNHSQAADAARDRINNGVRPGSDWWSQYHPDLAHWYYHHDWHNHPWNYWWRGAAWGAVGAWFPGVAWGAPIYYDYGADGNVVYNGGDVYVNGQDVGTDQQYAQSASELATVDPSYNEADQADDQWLPLGMFSIATSDQDTHPTRTIQLAVDKQGVISGSMYNSATKQSYVVQGRVDKQSQRVAMTVGDKFNVVLETGIYNLTKDQTPVLAHFADQRTANYLFVRLDPPPAEGSADAAAASDAATNGAAAQATDKLP
jgi:hypothetical protein